MVPEMTFRVHSRSSAMSSFVRLPGLSSETGRVGCTCFQTKIAEITLKIDQGHWPHSSIGHTYKSLSVSGLYRFEDIQRRIMYNGLA